MKVSKGKNKRKLSSRPYRKWGSKRLSRNPLSELLLIGSFKKRITDLSRNNSHLSSALQESLIESARLNNLLKSYTKVYNQILFARIKLNEMARNLARFATDVEEVRNCLDIELPAEFNFFQKKGFSDEGIAKVPDVSCIDEEPELSADEVDDCEKAEVFHNNSVENAAPTIQDVQMTPILYDEDDIQDIKKKNSNVVYKGSLTPQLNIDLTFVKPKRSTRSKGKTPSLGKKRSSGRLVTQINPVSSPPLSQVQDSIETNGVASNDLLPVCNIEEKFEDVEVLLQNHSNSLIDCNNDCSVILNSNLNVKDEKTVLNDDLNQSSEITEKVCSLQPIDDEYNSSFHVSLENKSNIHKNLEEINENCDELSPDECKLSNRRNSRKLPDISQNVSSLHSGIHEHDEDIQNVGSLTFCESDDDSEEKNRASSNIRSSRSRKPLSYADYFSSDESDTDSPFRLAVTKRKSSKKINLNYISNDNSYEKAITKSAVEILSDDVTGIFEPDYSVYDLDVSDSKGKGKKFKKKTSSIKSKRKNRSDLPKPLFQKCSVTKLKGGEHEFSKFESPSELNSINKHTQKLLQNSCASPGGILKKAQSSISKICEDKKNEAQLNDTENIDDLHMQNTKQYSLLQTPKRVSFAPTDLVCNFEKMSVSKTIADNKKVRRTSKSVVDLTDLFDKNQSKISPINTELFDEDESKTSPTNTDIPSKEKDAEKLDNSILFDFSEDTEMYTITFPLSKQIFPTDNDASSKPSLSLVSEQKKSTNNRSEMPTNKSPEVLPKSPKSIKKLSLKENKVVRNSVPQCNLDKTELKAAILFMESPVSFLKKPKRKSLFKEFPDDALKENLIFDHPVSEKKDSLENKIKMNESSSSPALTVGIKKSSNSKCQITIRSKTSTKKNKKSNLQKKSLEQSPLLLDTTNVLDLTDGNQSRRRTKQVCYKETSLRKKLRRE